MNILLITGGWSTERNVALSGSKGVHEALLGLGHTVRIFDPEYSLHGLLDAAEEADFAFIMLHGSPGEDGLIQAMLERIGVPYQGAGPAGSMLALDKSASKVLFVKAGLPTAPWHLLPQHPGPAWRPDFSFPIFVKANTGGSSLHMQRVATAEELPAALDALFAVGSSYIVEPAVQGLELTCGVLGEVRNGKEIPVALPPILIKPRNESGIFDYAEKYSVEGGAEEICPAPIAEDSTKQVQDIALKAHRVLGLSGYSRADFILSKTGDLVLLEVNTLPGMTKTSLLPQEAAAVGISFDALVQRLIELGLARRNSCGEVAKRKR